MRLSAIGDVIKALPALQVLRRSFPQAFIGWVVEEKAMPVLAGQRAVSELFVFRRGGARGLTDLGPAWFSAAGAALAVCRKVRALRFDVVYDLQGNAKSALFTCLSGAPLRVGFDSGGSRELAQVAYNSRVRVDNGCINAAEKNLLLLGATGLDTRTEGPYFNIAERDRGMVDGLSRSLFSKARRFVVLHPGTSAFGSYKRWPAEKYRSLAARIASETGDAVLITWGRGEEAVARRIAHGLSDKVAALHHALTIGELAAILEQASAFVGSDSAPLHLAASLYVPSVALFGPKDPAVFGPWQAKSVVVSRNLPCSPCGMRTCDRPECMTGISVDEVFGALVNILADER
jgi:lipopolysaccharide heptosyltransferase I